MVLYPFRRTFLLVAKYLLFYWKNHQKLNNNSIAINEAEGVAKGAQEMEAGGGSYKVTTITTEQMQYNQ